MFEALKLEYVRSGAYASSSKGKQPATRLTPGMAPTDVDPSHPASPGEQRAVSPSSSDSSGVTPPHTHPTATGATAAANAQVLASQHFQTPTPQAVQPDALEEPADRWCCVICKEVLLDPVTIPCGHTLDRNCLHHLLNQGVTPGRRPRRGLRVEMPKCPFCRAELPSECPEISVDLRDLLEEKCPEQVALRRKQVACAAATDILHKVLATENQDELLDLMDQATEAVDTAALRSGVQAVVQLQEEALRAARAAADAASNTLRTQAASVWRSFLAMDSAGNPSLHQVAVRMLAEAGADVTEKGANGHTLLHTAANRADAPLVAALLQAGARDGDGSALDVARRRKLPEIECLLSRAPDGLTS